MKQYLTTRKGSLEIMGFLNFKIQSLFFLIWFKEMGNKAKFYQERMIYTRAEYLRNMEGAKISRKEESS